MAESVGRKQEEDGVRALGKKTATLLGNLGACSCLPLTLCTWSVWKSVRSSSKDNAPLGTGGGGVRAG